MAVLFILACAALAILGVAIELLERRTRAETDRHDHDASHRRLLGELRRQP